MFSIENSSDPSCSSSKASDLVSGYEDQPQLAPKFSIRDYVFRIRSKDFRISWPFREQLLQLCLDNGITELLPPLQPRSVVKSHCVENKTVFANGELKDGVELEPSLPLDSSVSIPQEKRKLKVKLTRSESENNTSSLTSHVSAEEILGDQLSKNKCRLAEDLASNLSTVSDPMASKICPVCKLFTSTSNNTLNAHIDRCLCSDQSNAKKDHTAQFFRPKEKPRKKRLMVDIYETAPYCTLKDLDRRNGTNWTGSPDIVAPSNDVDLEPKRPKISPLDVVCKGKVGDIYVDSNGTKLLILSQFADSPPLVSRKDFKLKKHDKGYPANPSSSLPKKNTLKPNWSKPMKDDPQSRKLSTDKGFKGRIAGATEIEHITEDDHEKEESLSQPLNAHDHVKNSGHSTLGHWVCSKRSNLTRKLVNNDTSKGLENAIATTGKLSFKQTQPEECHTSNGRVCALNLPSSSETVVPPKFKDKGICSQPSETCKSLGEDNCFDVSLQPSSPNESDHRSLKDKKTSTSKRSDLSRRMCFSLRGLKADKRERFVTPKKIKKSRSLLACSKWREGESCSGANAASYGCTKDLDLISSRANKASEIHSSNITENQEGECLVVKDQMSSADLEQVESISRDETQVELLTQRSSDNQEVHCEDVICNGVVSQDVQISVDHAEPTVQTEEIQDHNPFSSGDGDMGPEKTQENTSPISIRFKSNHDNKRIADVEVSVCSEVSNTSTISPSQVNDNSKDLKAEWLSSLIVRKDNNVKSSPSPRESSCSCSESLSREPQLSNQAGKNTASNTFMKPPALDSPKSCSPPASNPVLRLMGKDLVVNKEESVQVPKILPNCTNYASEAKFISFAVPHNVGFIGYNDYYNYQMQAIGNHQFPNSPLMFAQPQHRPKPMFPSSQAREVIVIDDDSPALDTEPRTNFTTPVQSVQNSNIMGPQKLFACIPSQNPYASRAFTSNRRVVPEGSFIFPPPSSLYFSPSLR